MPRAVSVFVGAVCSLHSPDSAGSAIQSVARSPVLSTPPFAAELEGGNTMNQSKNAGKLASAKSMVVVRVRDLCGDALDFAVAECEDEKYEPAISYDGIGNEYPATRYSTDPALAWPIIEREGISIRKIVTPPFGVFATRHYDVTRGDIVFRPEGCRHDMVRRPNPPHKYEGWWLAKMPIGTGSQDKWGIEHFLSPTSLVAAMRCFVEHRLGKEIEVPPNLMRNANMTK